MNNQLQKSKWIVLCLLFSLTNRLISQEATISNDSKSEAEKKTAAFEQKYSIDSVQILVRSPSKTVGLSQTVDIQLTMTYPKELQIIRPILKFRQNQFLNEVSFQDEGPDRMGEQLEFVSFQRSFILEPVFVGKSDSIQMQISYRTDKSQDWKTESINLGSWEIVAEPIEGIVSTDSILDLNWEQMSQPSQKQSQDWVSTAFVFFGIFLLLLTVYWVFTSKQKMPVETHTVLDRAKNELESLQNRSMEDYRFKIVLICDLVRNYLVEAYQIPADRRTSLEILTEIASNNVSNQYILKDESRERLEQFLNVVDPDKFAQVVPDENECLRCIDLARQFMQLEST